jgi:DNA-binding CsgD family transcriptional regulator/pimeloyl-ACP methyl ester carboxylesterase
MTEPRIRYSLSQGGVRIAFWAIGSGYPIVQLPSPTASNLQKEWASPDTRAWYESLAQDFMVVRYDQRGLGLSDRSVGNLSMKAMVDDLDSVVRALGFRSFALFAGAAAAPVAIEYAAENESVSHLILWHAVAKGSEFFEAEERRALQVLAKEDWHLFSLAAASAYSGWTSGENTRAQASILEDAGPEFFFRMVDAERVFDARRFLPNVRAKTLVLHRRNYTAVDISNSLFLASHIPDARLEILGGASGIYWRDEEVVEAVRGFLAEDIAAAWLGSIDLESNDSINSVTVRERGVLRLVASGLGNAEVAARLGISIHTVERHLANVYEKWGVHSRVELTLQLLKRGHHDAGTAGEIRA